MVQSSGICYIEGSYNIRKQRSAHNLVLRSLGVCKSHCFATGIKLAVSEGLAAKCRTYSSLRFKYV